MSYATLGIAPVLVGRMVIPFAGLWHASLVLTSDTPSPGPQILTIGTSTWICSPVRDIVFSGQRGILVVGGSGGWRTSVSPKQYGQGAIPIAGILADAATACGELPPVGAVGVVPAYVRKGAPYAAATVLQELLGDGWWVDDTGVVQATPRLPAPVLSPFDAMSVDGAVGLYEIATESPFDWTPGATFLGTTVSGTVSRVMHAITPDRLRTEIMVTP